MKATSHGASTWGPALLLDDVSAPSSAAENFVLLAGPTGCGKTSLLFQRAANACRAGRHVVFVCFEAPMKRRAPLAQRAFRGVSISTRTDSTSSSSSSSPSSSSSSNDSDVSMARSAVAMDLHARRPDPSLQHMHLKYLPAATYDAPQRSSAELVAYLSQMHRLPRQPHLIVVDDMSLLQCSAPSLAHILGLLERARAHATSVHRWRASANSIDGSSLLSSSSSSSSSSDHTCRVIVADSICQGAQHVHHERIFLRFVKSIWKVEPAVPSETDEESHRDAHMLKFQVSRHGLREGEKSVPAFRMGIIQRNGVAMLATLRGTSP